MLTRRFLFPAMHTQLVRGALVALIAGFIVQMTSQPAIASTASSQVIATIVAKCLLSLPNSDMLLSLWGLPAKLTLLAPALDHAVRKTAHFTEYAALGFVLVAWLRHTRRFERHAYWMALTAGALFACSDEWHQTFVPGRSGQLSDVLLDTTGCLFGILVYYCFKVFFVAIQKKRASAQKRKSSGISVQPVA